MKKEQIGTKSERLLEEKLDAAKFQERHSELTTIPLRLLSELDDVVITNPQNNDFLMYDSSSGKWVNSAGA